MIPRFLADLIVLLHLAFVAFVVLGGLLVLLRRWVAWIHLPCAAWGALISFAGWICPLTPIEVRLRRAAGQAGYDGGFVEHYVLQVLYADSLTRPKQVAIGVFVILINILAYAVVWRRARARPLKPHLSVGPEAADSPAEAAESNATSGKRHSMRSTGSASGPFKTSRR